MTFIDLRTGWPEAFCTKDSNAKTTAEVFLYDIICHYGKVDRFFFVFFLFSIFIQVYKSNINSVIPLNTCYLLSNI